MRLSTENERQQGDLYVLGAGGIGGNTHAREQSLPMAMPLSYLFFFLFQKAIEAALHHK